MGRRQTALVKPAVLEWARRSVDMTIEEAARRLGQPAATISAWESGSAAPSVVQLRKMSEVYKRPLAVFYLAEPPRDFDALHDFRRLPSNVSRNWTPALHFEYRRAQEQRDSLFEVTRRGDEEIPVAWRVTAPSRNISAEVLGSVMREALGVTIGEQKTWTEKYRALGGWIRAAEDSGILVIQTDKIDISEMRGFSIYADEFPIIAINGSDFVRGKIFSLLHEYAHLVLRQSGLCDQVSDRRPSTEDRRLEALCNQAAAAALIPASELLTESVVAAAPAGFEAWTSDALISLSRSYGASEEAILRRLQTLGKTTVAFYQRRREEYLRIYEEERTRQREEQKVKPGGPTYYRVRARNLGKGYVRAISHAYARDVIDTLETANYLGVKVQHLGKLADEAFGRTG